MSYPFDWEEYTEKDPCEILDDTIFDYITLEEDKLEEIKETSKMLDKEPYEYEFLKNSHNNSSHKG